MSQKGPFIWEAHEFIFQEKTSDWYWIVGIIGLSISALSYIFGGVLFSLLMALITLVLMIMGSKKPGFIRFEVSKKGLMINNTLYPFASLESFWVEDQSHLDLPSKLIIKSQKRLVPLIIIPLEGVSPEDIRDFLLDNLYEEKHGEPVGQKIMEYFGF
jgi:hypothetical protein